MGAKVWDAEHGFIRCETDGLRGNDINLDYPSVGATENIMLAAVFADGETYIRNAAKEPEIVDLQNYLAGMGVNIVGAGTGVIRIKGTKDRLRSSQYSVMPDRIVAGTYMAAVAMTSGDVVLKGVVPEHLTSIIANLRDCGCRVNAKRGIMHVSGPAKPKALDTVRTLPYPGFPTDMQAQIMAVLAVSRGTSIITETIFENRYRHAEELLKMGANIRTDGRLAVIKGVKKLVGSNVTARDLRGGAALVLAGLEAEGQTVVQGIEHIDRGYESIEQILSGLGALIRREEDTDEKKA